jgi:hypothetical protein
VGDKSDIGALPRFMDTYELTGNQDDTVKLSEVKTFLKSKDLLISLPKLLMEINQYMKLNRLTVVTEKKVTVGINVPRQKLWYGIRSRYSENVPLHNGC